jgi:glycosyltransferase involved in cell wall biosynthesis
MARSLVAQGVHVDVATTDDDGPGGRLAVPLSQRIEREGYGVFYFRKQTEFYKVSLPFCRWLAARVADYDLVHIHTVFSYTSTVAARWSRRQGVPYIVRPLGVLNRWGMVNRRRLIKSLSFRFVEQPLLRRAAAMHYTSRAEQREAEQTGATAPAAVIPLGLDLAAFERLPGAERFLNQFPQARGRVLVLFLSRLDPKKGLDLLLPAFAEARRHYPSAMLVVAGNGEQNFVAGLHDRASQLGLAQDLVWAGFLSGEDKLAAFAAASVFMLPSYSENFGIALIEAMAAGLPCLATPGVAVAEDLQTCAPDALLVAPAEVKPLAEALGRLLGDAAGRAQLGAKARQVASAHFSLSAMGTALRELYSKVQKGSQDRR